MDILLELAKYNNIKFYEGNHTYKFEGIEKPATSVTTLVHKYINPFDPDGEIRKKKAKKLKITEAELQQQWDETRNTSAAAGTVFHSYMEYFMQNKFLKDINIPPKLARFAFNFYKTAMRQGGLIPVKNELVIGLKELGIAGTIDQLYYNKTTGKIHICDWKTNKEFKFQNNFGDFLKPPVSHLQNCEFDIYSLQLSIYRYLLEISTELKMGKSFVVWFNANNDDYQIIKMPYLKKEVIDIIEDFQNVA